jgi:phospholipase/carboxylesterase
MIRRIYSLIALIIMTSTVGAMELPERDTPRPETTNGVPHIQIGIEPVPELSAELLRRVAEFPGVTLGATRISLPGATGFQLDDNLALAQPNAIVGGREFAHVHPDGSLHASLHPDTARAAVKAGWAIMHPWANQRAGWEGFVMIYTPVNEAELEIVFQLVQSSYKFVTGQT